MKFADYPITPALKDNLARLNFKKPTDIQYKAIYPILRGEDVLAIAQTGTGKTAAFAIPIISRLHDKKKDARRKDGIKCLVMVPTRELALQITEVFNQLAEHTLVRTMSLFGGVGQDAQIAQLQKGCDVAIATPGRMFDLISQGYLDLHRVDTLVLDEADHMLDLGFIKDIKDVMRHLPKQRQTLFFSATINSNIKRLAYNIVRNAIRIQVSPKDPVSKNVHHMVAFIEMDEKRFFLERIMKDHPNAKVLAFVRTQVRAERVAKAMERAKIVANTIHGGKEQAERLQSLEAFKRGTCRLLIATDVSARGIDIPDVNFVVNYDLPEQADNYVHRVGRTGRGRDKGQAIAFCAKGEKELLEKIETYMGKAIERVDINSAERANTLDLKHDASNDWKGLIADFEADEAEFKRKKKSKKR